MTVIPLKRPPDKHLERLEADKAFWLHELKQASREYMQACMKLALYRQGRIHEE